MLSCATLGPVCPQELINLYAIPRLQPCSALSARLTTPQKPTRCNPTPLRSSLLLSGSIVEHLKQTPVCVTTEVPKGAGERWMRKNGGYSSSCTLTSHYLQPGESGKVLEKWKLTVVACRSWPVKASHLYIFKNENRSMQLSSKANTQRRSVLIVVSPERGFRTARATETA